MSHFLQALGATGVLRHKAAMNQAERAAKNAFAAKAIADAAEAGNPAAEGFVAEATSRIDVAQIRRRRAKRLRSGAAKAAVLGSERLAALGSDAALAEDLAGEQLEGDVVNGVETAYGAAPYFLSPREADILRQNAILQDSTVAFAESALASLLSRQMDDASNFGDDSVEGEEVGDGEAAIRLALAADAFGGDADLVLGDGSLDVIGDVFKVSREKLEERLAKREERLAKLQEKVESDEKGFLLKPRIAMLEKNIARLKDKIAKLDPSEGKVVVAKKDAKKVKAAEADALSETDESELPEGDDDLVQGDAMGDADVLGMDDATGSADESLGVHRRHHHRRWGGGGRRRGWGGGGGGWGPVIVEEPVVFVDDDDDLLFGDDAMGRAAPRGARRALRRGDATLQPQGGGGGGDEGVDDGGDGGGDAEYGGKERIQKHIDRIEATLEKIQETGKVPAGQRAGSWLKALMLGPLGPLVLAMGHPKPWWKVDKWIAWLEKSKAKLEAKLDEGGEDDDVLGMDDDGTGADEMGDDFGAGFQPVATDRHPFVVFFDARADSFGATAAAAEERMAAEQEATGDDVLGGFFDAIGEFFASIPERFVSIFASGKTAVLTEKAALAARHAARAPLTPDVETAREARRKAGQEAAAPIREHRRDLRQATADQGEKEKAAASALKKATQELIDGGASPEDAARLAPEYVQEMIDGGVSPEDAARFWAPQYVREMHGSRAGEQLISSLVQQEGIGPYDTVGDESMGAWAYARRRPRRRARGGWYGAEGEGEGGAGGPGPVESILQAAQAARGRNPALLARLADQALRASGGLDGGLPGDDVDLVGD